MPVGLAFLSAFAAAVFVSPHLFNGLLALGRAVPAAEFLRDTEFEKVFGRTFVLTLMVSFAAFASLPKYATGGIIDANSGVIPGNQFSGDKVLARVNSGELILNKAQQRNIAAQLSADRTQRLDVNIIGRISGRDLEFVLDRRKQYNGYAL